MAKKSLEIARVIEFRARFSHHVLSVDSCECRVLESGSLRDTVPANLILPLYICAAVAGPGIFARHRNELHAREYEKKRMRPTNQTENATNRRRIS